VSIATAPPSLITTTIGRLSSKFSNYQHEDGRPHEQRRSLRGRIIFHRFEHLYAMTVNGAVREQNRNNTIPTSLNAFSVHDIVAVHRPRLSFITSLPRMKRQPSALEGIRHRRQPHFKVLSLPHGLPSTWGLSSRPLELRSLLSLPLLLVVGEAFLGVVRE